MMRKAVFAVVSLFALFGAANAHALIAGGCGTACLTMGGSGIPGSDDILVYALRQLALVAAFYISGYCLGRQVRKGRLSASLSRKGVCLLTFAVSFANSLSMSAYTVPVTVGFIALGGACILLLIGSLSSPVRRRFPILGTVFASINRPEDEPHTLRWLASEAAATALVLMMLVPVISWFTADFVGDGRILYGLMLIPVFASGVGDALAEIVGKKWGRRHYAARALFGGGLYHRTLEGSAMVFLTTLATGLAVAASFSFAMPLFFWKAFILLPVTLTLAEARAPHTWDNPFLYLVGYGTIIVCLL